MSTDRETRHRTILLIAGEVSGDHNGAFLARALRSLDGAVTLLGAGGDRMRAEGVDVRIATSHLGCVGLSESMGFVLPLRRVLRDIRTLVRDERPQVAVLIDNEGFNAILARMLRRAGVRVVFYFAPQVWLWGQWRAKRIARSAHLVISVFRPEARIYGGYGTRVEWVGHPLLDVVKPDGNYAAACAAAGIELAAPIIAVMPGSRLHEIRRLTPVMLEAARIIAERYPRLLVILPLASPLWRPAIEKAVEQSGIAQRIRIVEGNDRYTLLARCRVAIVKSGTGTLEAALLEVPMVVAYRISSLSYLAARLLVNTRFMAMPNILARAKIVPEFCQGEATPAHLAEAALQLIDNDEAAEEMRRRLRLLRSELGVQGAVERAARLVLEEAAMAEGGVTEP